MASHLKDAEEEAKPDMTPMIDAVFLLIIFFLCIDFKTLEAKLPAYLPKDKGSQATSSPPVEQLSLKILNDEWGREVPRIPGKAKPFALIGHKVHWLLGPKKFTELTELVDELERIASDPRQRVPDDKNPGRMKKKPIVIEPQPGATYGDVATTVDAVTKAGFEEINFGGGRGTRQQ